MIGLVLVSHSEALARGTLDLAQQMTQGRVPMAVAGGIDDAQHPIGTDPIRVMAAISEVYSPDGVILFMDLGSALMSAETAIDLLDPDWRPHIHLCDAPFVEGAVTAAVSASAGGSVEQVMAAARGALGAKQTHLGQLPVSPAAAAAPQGASGQSEQISITLPNRLGLHARPAARIVLLNGDHAARLTLRKGERSADGRDINAIMLLDARRGDAVDFIAEGEGARALLDALRALAAQNFGDDDRDAPASPAAAQSDLPPNVIQGVSAAKGIAIGRIYKADMQPPVIERDRRHPVEVERAALMTALRDSVDALQAAAAQARTARSEAQAAIFEAHELLLKNDPLIAEVEERLTREPISAGAAWWEAIEALAERYRRADSALLQGRAADVVDVGRRVLALLAPQSVRPVPVQTPSVLAAPDLVPSETARLDRSNVLAILTQQGGATSHTAIIARGMGIPAVVGLGDAYAALADGAQVIVDGERGWVFLAPTVEQLADYEAQRVQEQQARAHLLSAAASEARTRDGHRVEVGANIGVAQDTAGLLERGAEGVGLFRTELLFMERSSAPSEDEQYRAYVEAAKALEGRPVIVRTLDVGGDKAIPYIDIPPEENPFLGYRGIRYWLGNRPLARAQMRAILRAGAEHNIKVMFPMVSTREEVSAIDDLIHEMAAELDADGIPYNPHIEKGIMVEVPSAVLRADVLAEGVDFFSIGTNDLTQYLMAADRGNARVTPLASPFQPAVLSAIHQVVQAAHAHGKWVGICGEMAGNPLLTRVLIGLGVDELSMNAPAIPEVKRIIRETTLAEAQALARNILALATAREVEVVLRSQG